LTDRLVVATTNPNKTREIRALLAGLDVDLSTLEAWAAIAAPEETGRTFEENARLKALYYAAATGELVVAEDSGLEIDALGGRPGVESARFGGFDTTYPRKFQLIEEEMKELGAAGSTARFVCALALARGNRLLFETRGVVEGQVTFPARGTSGFGYDPLFYYPPLNCTFAEATAEQKAAVSHRGRAFRALKKFLVEGNSRLPA
jgi:XTP/dITP diphosphohydrolase